MLQIINSPSQIASPLSTEPKGILKKPPEGLLSRMKSCWNRFSQFFAGTNFNVSLFPYESRVSVYKTPEKKVEISDKLKIDEPCEDPELTDSSTYTKYTKTEQHRSNLQGLPVKNHKKQSVQKSDNDGKLYYARYEDPNRKSRVKAWHTHYE